MRLYTMIVGTFWSMVLMLKPLSGMIMHIIWMFNYPLLSSSGIDWTDWCTPRYTRHLRKRTINFVMNYGTVNTIQWVLRELVQLWQLEISCRFTGLNITDLQDFQTEILGNHSAILYVCIYVCICKHLICLVVLNFMHSVHSWSLHKETPKYNILSNKINHSTLGL